MQSGNGRCYNSKSCLNVRLPDPDRLGEAIGLQRLRAK